MRGGMTHSSGGLDVFVHGSEALRPPGRDGARSDEQILVLDRVALQFCDTR